MVSKKNLVELFRDGLEDEVKQRFGERAVDLVEQQLHDLETPRPSMATSESDVAGELVDFPELNNDSLERVIGRKNFLRVSFLEKALDVQRSVARIVLTEPFGSLGPGDGFGTSFLVGTDLLITNNHVVPDKDFLKKIRVQFNFQKDSVGIDRPTQSFSPIDDPQEVDFHTNAALDYTVIRLQSRPSASGPIAAGDEWGTIRLNSSVRFFRDQRLNIIQHPQGRQKELVVQDNKIDRLFQNAVRYTADTEPGSSGSPVFDNHWRLVALHHSGGDRNANGQFINNEGIRIDRIVDDLRAHFGAVDGGSAVTAALGI